MDSAQLPAPQLGRILIAARLLTEFELAEALQEQARTGRRLGEIIVERGFISGPALANALAEQHGGVLKTEYGYASGLGGEVVKRAAAAGGSPTAAGGPAIPRLRTVEAPAAEASAQPEPQREPDVQPEPQREGDADAESAPVQASVPAEAEPIAPAPPEPVAEPVPEPVAHAEPAPERELAVEPELESPAHVIAAQPPPEHDERDELLESLRARIDAQEAELIALREALERAQTREHAREQAPEDRDAAPPAPEPEPGTTAPPVTLQVEDYLLCVATPAGYVLLDRHGVVPVVGQPVDVPEEDGEFSVVKVLRLPRNGRACAYLQRDRPHP